jgi:hypothetical protein
MRPSISGDDPGAGFDGYLATPQRIGSWVAGSRGRIVGLTGLLDQGTSAEVEPVVVTGAARDQGIGRRRHEWLPGAGLHGLDFDY